MRESEKKRERMFRKDWQTKDRMKNIQQDEKTKDNQQAFEIISNLKGILLLVLMLPSKHTN